MKNICLSIALLVVSVFSVSAQTGYKSVDKSIPLESIKVNPERLEARTESAKTTEARTDTVSPKTEGLPAESSGILSGSTLMSLKKSALGSFSTGNPVIDGYIEEFSTLYNVDPLLIFAQMNQESSFKARATSPKGASGFMQLMPDTARRFGVRNIYDPKQNIQAGIKYMRWLLDKFGGDTRLALAGYNAGEGAVMKHGNKIPPYRETQNYVVKIMNHYEQISNQNSMLGQAFNNMNKVY